MSYLLGIDVGTSGTKAVLIREDGKVIASHTENYPLHCLKPLWAEQNPADWWKATIQVIRAVSKNIKTDEIKGIGLSGQMHGLVLLDDADKVLRPVILWCDQRTKEECDYITKTIKNLHKFTCNAALTGFTAPKILWVRKHEPNVYKRIKKILLPKDYIRFYLTEEFASDVSDASGTLLFDVRNRMWSEEVLNILKIDKKFLAKVYESPEITGTLSKKAAKETGLPIGIPVVAGTGDQAGGAIGNGIVKDGVVSVAIGTSGVVFASTDKLHDDPKERLHSFCHAVPNKWHVMGVMLAAGGSFQWFRNNLAELEIIEAKKKKCDPYEILTKKAEKASINSEGLIFLPYLMGERTPHNNPYAKGVWFGLTMRHKKEHLIRSVMEGVSFGLRDSYELIKELKINVREIRISGGGTRSKLWCKIIADIFGREVYIVRASEGPAFGVALLAGVGTKIYRTVEEACRKTIKGLIVIAPTKENIKLYDEQYSIYKKLYEDLKGNFN